MNRYAFTGCFSLVLGIAAVVSAPEDSTVIQLGVKAVIPGLVIWGFVWIMNRITSPAEPPTKDAD